MAYLRDPRFQLGNNCPKRNLTWKMFCKCNCALGDVSVCVNINISLSILYTGVFVYSNDAMHASIHNLDIELTPIRSDIEVCMPSCTLQLRGIYWNFSSSLLQIRLINISYMVNMFYRDRYCGMRLEPESFADQKIIYSGTVCISCSMQCRDNSYMIGSRVKRGLKIPG